MMATTELDKIPETVLSRSQVYEFRTISTKAIADQLRTNRRRRRDHGRRRVAAAHRARRRRQHARRAEQARSGDRVHRHDDHGRGRRRPCSAWSAATCCSTPSQAVADEDAPAAFALAGARGRDGLRPARGLPRAVARRARSAGALGRSVAHRRSRDRRRRRARSADRRSPARFSREDLLRAFDLLTRAEADIRGAAQPRYHLEMALLRWMHLRKLVPIEDLIAGGGAPAATAGRQPSAAERPLAAATAAARCRVRPRPSTPSARHQVAPAERTA